MNRREAGDQFNPRNLTLSWQKNWLAVLRPTENHRDSAENNPPQTNNPQRPTTNDQQTKRKNQKQTKTHLATLETQKDLLDHCTPWPAFLSDLLFAYSIHTDRWFRRGKKRKPQTENTPFYPLSRFSFLKQKRRRRWRATASHTWPMSSSISTRN